MRVLIGLLLAVSLGCAPRPVPVAVARLAPDVLAARLADADRLASRGCYLCLKEAAAAYGALLGQTDDRTVAAHALENNLMLALREIELRIPDSGALDAARQLQDRVGSHYTPYFAALEALRPASPVYFVRGEPLLLKQEREERLKLVAELRHDPSTSPMRTYFFLALLLQLRQFKDIKAQVDEMLAVHPHDLSLKYHMLAFQPTYSAEAARNLIGQETGFGEVHLLIGQRAVMGGDLAGAFRELTRARELLPDSVTIVLALANVTFSYARYAEALQLFDSVLASPVAGFEPQARLGRARALSYLKRHDEAIAVLIELLQHDPTDNPGEKYYWRAWNRLQVGQAQLAYNDATTGLNAMRNDAIYRLAGMATFSLNRLGESRALFEQALEMNRADCDSARYLGLLDLAGRHWNPAVDRFSAAASCYETVLAQLQRDLAEYETDITGLSSGLIASTRVQIREATALRDQSILNAAAATRNAGSK